MNIAGSRLAKFVPLLSMFCVTLVTLLSSLAVKFPWNVILNAPLGTFIPPAPVTVFAMLVIFITPEAAFVTVQFRNAGLLWEAFCVLAHLKLSVVRFLLVVRFTKYGVSVPFGSPVIVSV